jgi:hypothetical protein
MLSNKTLFQGGLMKYDGRSLAWFLLIVAFLFGLGTLAAAGHVFWLVFLIVVGAYIAGQMPTLFLRIRSFLSRRGLGPNKDP